MKTRNGFVSNSSSSSFIVAFPELPTSRSHIQKMVFGDEEYFPDPFYDPKDNDKSWARKESYSTSQIAETLWNVINNEIDGQKPNDYKAMHTAMNEYSTDCCNDCACHLSEPIYLEAEGKYVEKEIFDFLQANPNSFIYTFSFSDNDGQYFEALEHGDLFKKLPHKRYSHH